MQFENSAGSMALILLIISLSAKNRAEPANSQVGDLAHTQRDGRKLNALSGSRDNLDGEVSGILLLSPQQMLYKLH